MTAFFGLSSDPTPNFSLKAGRLKTKLSPCSLLPASSAHDVCDKFISGITPQRQASSQPSPLVQRTESTSQGSARTGSCEKCLPGCVPRDTFPPCSPRPEPWHGTCLTVNVWTRPPEGRRRPWLAFPRLVRWVVIEGCSTSGSCVLQVSDFLSLDSVSESAD